VDLHKIIKELQEERKKLDQIVSSLEQLNISSEQTPVTEKHRGRKSMDAKARLEVSQRMKRYWDSRRSKADHA
jgi:hypothetical protein